MSRHGAGVPSRAMWRDASRRRVWLGGFNLLPYRQREARLAQRRWVLDIVGAVCFGIAGGALSYAVQSVERSRIDARRAAVERELAIAAPRARAREAAQRAREAARQHDSVLAREAQPWVQAVGLFDALRTLDYRAVTLMSLRQSDREAEIDALAGNAAEAARWIGALHAARPGWQVRVAGFDGRPTGAGGASVRFAVRILWPAQPGRGEPKPVAGDDARRQP